MTVGVLHGDCRDHLAQMATDGVRVHSVVTDLAAGTAAEHLVCADLLLQGYRAFLSDQNCPFDVAVDLGGRLIRVQVKATRLLRKIPNRPSGDGSAYMFHTRRAGKGGRRTYGAGEFDIMACVALDIRKIAYLPVSNIVRQTVHLRPPGAALAHGNNKHRAIDGYSFSAALSEMR